MTLALTFRQLLHALLLLGVAFMISGTTGDPDLWGHVRFGQDMIAQRSVQLADVYSFTTDRPWINHEWLSEVLMAMAFNAFGPAGLNLLRVATIGAVLALVWRATSEIGRRRIMLVALASLGIYMRAHPIRPQIFSLLMFAVLLTLLKSVEDRRSIWPLLWVPVVMAAWVNLHGGWIVGLGVLAWWTAIRLIASDRHRLVVACTLCAAAAATLLNPFGSAMWSFLLETVRPERRMIADWQPLYALPAILWMSWLAGVGVLALSARASKGREDWLRLAIIGALGIAAVRVSRLDAFFALAGVFFGASMLSGPEPESSAPERVRRSPAFAILLLACVVPVGYLVWARVVAIPVPAYFMPDANVASYVRDERLRGRVLTWFDWGQYAIWHFGPELKVSMDGRRETVYTPEVVNAHLRFYSGGPSDWQYADAINADYVWIPKALPIAKELPLHGWQPLCEGPTSVLFAETNASPEVVRRISGGRPVVSTAMTAQARRRVAPRVADECRIGSSAPLILPRRGTEVVVPGPPRKRFVP